MWRNRVLSLALLVPVAAAGLGITSSSAHVGRPDPTRGGARTDTSAVQRAPKERGTVVFTTAQSQFDPGINNQGWWAESGGNYDANDNYIVGPFSGEYRDFFTFDVSALDRPIISATLRVNAGTVNTLSGPEVLQFHDVSTDAATLNSNDGVNPAIFDDLGTGDLYGEYAIGSTQQDQQLSFDLNKAALHDLKRAAKHAPGGYFSLGGRMVNAAPGSYLFGFSQGGNIELVVRTR